MVHKQYYFEHIQLPNPGLTRGVIPEDIYQPVMQEIREIEKDDRGIYKVNRDLSGQIEREYRLEKSKPHIVPFLEGMGREYQKKWGCHQGYDLKVDSLWVNLQQKTEYNPLHNHNGILSYVAWMDIPYKLEDEMNQQNCKNSAFKESSASFQFIYNSIMGNIVNEIYKVENGWEGMIVMFPAQLLHIVYPFYTSEGYRISIAGNLS
tara:strand:- start:114 stop:731 length:618 start_codon:yes stop_codon:yes gene_type:complete